MTMAELTRHRRRERIVKTHCEVGAVTIVLCNQTASLRLRMMKNGEAFRQIKGRFGCPKAGWVGSSSIERISQY